MANLRTAMDAAFWDLNISTPQVLDGVCRAVPGDPIPLDGAKASDALRIPQVSLLRNAFPLGIIPSYSPSPSHKQLGSFALQSYITEAAFGNWWVGLVGQFRPKKLISSIKAEASDVEEWKLPVLKDALKHFLDKSLYAIGLCLQISLTSSSSLIFRTEKHGERKRQCTKAMLFHKLEDHDVTLEASWPDLFMDRKGKYWEVPESLSFGCSSVISESGLRYRFGVHKNSGFPQAVDSIDGETPLALLPGLSAKGALSYEKSIDLWRQKETKEDVIIETENGQLWRPAYDIRLREPHAAISGIIGGNCGAWLGFGEGSASAADRAQVVKSSLWVNSRVRFGADLFGSICYTFQHGKFRSVLGDLSRIDTRLDIGSASALTKEIANLITGTRSSPSSILQASPRLNLILQQQVYGPVVFRVDSKFSLDSFGKQSLKLEDVICSLNYYLRFLGSGKIVGWYSPKRKEGMVELRMFEF